MRCFWELTRFLLVSYLICCPGEGAKGRDGNEQASRPRRKGKGKMLPNKGVLTTREGHECSWEVQGQEESTLQLNCTDQGNSYVCQYNGTPRSCLAYSSRAAQYWKQVLSKVKRKKHACQGDATLKARVCKQGPPESQLKLKGKSPEPGRRKEKARFRGTGRLKEQRAGLGQPEPTLKTRKKTSSKSKASDSVRGEEPSSLSEMNNDHPDLQGDLSQVYCARKWHSLCSFFVGLWNG
ncbi:fibroblast growth factor-binding protein 3-like [Stegostoma tigrinum]|uniref:fibroblast growth factor-binding protein 3-like n=1 Tax=Stegostoma tigrinum TaxID=3053191 RepID=UPI00202B8046|nr:fibroblast growth factor-binding protein 3-like [Stegostoma tigrinum]XP_059508904.1 fibroblast growth factor-binding protein 3-like [Stegostoma tigrinum]XP_059508905.1 fibroblast growth factor-binding protein 3-like [Stegostoma tigrinum]XP_059508907.1 fibroblast growth factor-binding protein 3-like [Stegostoma tigrinum]